MNVFLLGSNVTQHSTTWL